MRKITLMMLISFSAATINSFAGDTKPKAAAKSNDVKASAKKCVMGGSCCKQTSRAALMKAKPVKKA